MAHPPVPSTRSQKGMVGCVNVPTLAGTGQLTVVEHRRRVRRLRQCSGMSPDGDRAGRPAAEPCLVGSR
jgi:hypothetical protein